MTIIYLLFGRETVFSGKNTIKRSDIGDTNKNYTLYVTSDKSLKNIELNFDVNAKRINSQDADEYFYNLFDSILPEILNGNADFLEIKTKLNLKNKYQNGIYANWHFNPKINTKEYILKYSNLIDGFGNVYNEDFEDGEEVEGTLNVNFSIDVSDAETDTKYKSDNYSIDVKVVKRDETESERLMKSIKKDIDNQNKVSTDTNNLILPTNINNEHISYKEKADFSFIYIILLGITVCFLLDYRDKDAIKKLEQKYKKEIKTDFPQIITKLLLFINAGVTVRNSFVMIADNYIFKLNKGQIEKRKAYEELRIFKTRIQGGENEDNCLYDIARNLNDNDYTRFFNILIQNIKNGNKDIKTVLEMEVYDALYKMKSNAEKLAEEASTKLILPLMMMLLIIFVIIMVPAFMSM